MKLTQKQEIDELKKRHVELFKALIMLSGYYNHLEDTYDNKIQQLDSKIDRLEKLVQTLIVTR